MSKALGVYVHWPYCARICPYCDFNVYKNRAIDAAAWKKALTKDLSHWARRTGQGKLTSLYFGGGTPSRAPVEIIGHVIETCEFLWGFEQGAEITLEANPTDTEQLHFKEIANAGVNRLSLGVQSLRDEALAFLGRDHDADAARRAIECAQETFARMTFDLIYARPRQTIEDWRAELTEALAFGAGHLSLYQLMIEPATAFARAVDKGRWAPLDDDRSADLFDATQELTAQAGLPAYEISNHARPGDQSRHNLVYWTYGDYVGVGPGAHGRLSANGARIATETLARPEDYLTAAAANAPMHVEAPLSATEANIERFSMGLRLIDGMALQPDDCFFEQGGAREKLRRLVEDGFLIWNGELLKASGNGRRLLNRVLYELLG
ncbi:radical SAM family heme chaperone HemW [Hyphococcus sp.]|uniref:radical SAM family heme chaperone HemW n=1 Tax=Hyphococcus sp. TaxID=2038636 RepID=UPI003CCBFDC5